MRRPCNQNEAAMLLACEQDVLPGPHQFKSAVSTSVNITAGILGGVMGGVLVATRDNHTQGAVVVRVTCFVIIAVLCVLLSVLSTNKDKEKKASGLVTDVRFVNTGTIMGIDTRAGYVYFIEDGFVDGRGLPYLMSLPVKDGFVFRQGQRVIVLMNSRGSYFLMQFSERNRGLFLSEVPPYDYFSLDLSSLVVLPHPSLLALNSTPRPLYQNEVLRARRAQKAAHLSRGFYLTLVVLGVLTLCISVVAAMAAIGTSSSGKTEPGVGFMIWLIMTSIFGIPELILWMIWKKKSSVFKNLPMMVSDVFFSHLQLSSTGLRYSAAVVYETTARGFERKEISFPGFDIAVAQKARYGQIIHKYTDGSRTYYDL